MMLIRDHGEIMVNRGKRVIFSYGYLILLVGAHLLMMFYVFLKDHPGSECEAGLRREDASEDSGEVGVKRPVVDEEVCDAGYFLVLTVVWTDRV